MGRDAQEVSGSSSAMFLLAPKSNQEGRERFSMLGGFWIKKGREMRLLKLASEFTRASESLEDLQRGCLWLSPIPRLSSLLATL
jgi:hypothetical protein